MKLTSQRGDIVHTEISAIVTCADGTVVDYGVVSRSTIDRRPLLRRLASRIGGFFK